MRKPSYGKKQRKLSADELLLERAKRSPAEQVNVLDERLGKDFGAAKERIKLAKLLEEK